MTQHVIHQMIILTPVTQMTLLGTWCFTSRACLPVLYCMYCIITQKGKQYSVWIKKNNKKYIILETKISSNVRLTFTIFFQVCVWGCVTSSVWVWQGVVGVREGSAEPRVPLCRVQKRVIWLGCWWRQVLYRLHCLVRVFHNPQGELLFRATLESEGTEMSCVYRGRVW